MGKGYPFEAVEKALPVYGHDKGIVSRITSSYKLKNKLIKAAPLFLALIALITIVFFLKPTAIGYAVKSSSFNFTDNVNLMINRSSEYIWNLENNGALKSVKLNGKVQAAGLVKAYLEYGNSSYLIFDNKRLGKNGLEKVTAFAVQEGDGQENNETDKNTAGKNPINETSIMNETQPVNVTAKENSSNETEIDKNKTVDINIPKNESIIIGLEYNKNTPYDENDDGIEPINGVIDFSVAKSAFNWSYNDPNLCTRWEVYSIETDKSTTACYGSNLCCNFIGLSPEREIWNETFYLAYGQYGSTFNNVISAQVLYVNYNLSINNPFAEVYYSSWKNLTAKFYEEFIDFEKACIETCILPGLNSTSYKIRIEIENSSLILDSISYDILSNETISNQTLNHAPVLLKNFSNISIFRGQSYSVSLNEYFYDEDNDTLFYNYYNNSVIDVAIINGTAAISPSGNFSGLSYMFFTANDSAEAAVSNVFGIEVKETEGGSLKSLRRIIGLK